MTSFFLVTLFVMPLLFGATLSRSCNTSNGGNYRFTHSDIWALCYLLLVFLFLICYVAR
jgi:hypothetical protein